MSYFYDPGQPTPAPPDMPDASPTAPTLTDKFSSAFYDQTRAQTLTRQADNQADWMQDKIDAFNRKNGQSQPNPLRGDWRSFFAVPGVYNPQQEMEDGVRAAFAKAGEQYPTDDEISQGGIDKQRAVEGRAQAADQGPQTILGRAAGLAGGLVGGSLNPVNQASVLLAPEGGILLRAAGMGATFAAGTAITGAATYPYQKQVTPGLTPGDIAREAALSFAQGAGFELAGAGLGMAWRRLVGARPDVAARAPLAVQDTGRVAEKAGDLAAQQPFPGAEDTQAHNASIAAAENAAQAGLPLDLPNEAKVEAAARRGSAYYPGGKVDLKYELAEHKDLVTSHDRDGFVNPAYPPELQPRDRASVASLDQVNSMAGSFEPERAGPNTNANEGPPIVGPDNVVESGNGRTAAIGAMYDRFPDRAAGYRAFLEQQGYDTAGMERPVLVGRRTSDAAALPPVPQGSVRVFHGAYDAEPWKDPESRRWVGSTFDYARNYGAGGRKVFYADVPVKDLPESIREQYELNRVAPSHFQLTPEQTATLRPAELNRAAFAQSLTGSGLKLGATEQALSDARHLSADVTDLAKSGDVGAAANRDFRRAWLAKLPQTERGEILTKRGELSALGERRLEAAMIARAYGDPTVVERLYSHADPNIKTIGSALRDSSVGWAKMRDAAARGDIAAGHDITEALMQTVRAIMRARDSGRPIWEVLNQTDAFHSDISQQATRFFMNAEQSKFLSAAKMTENLNSYAEESLKNTEGGRLFGEAAKPEEVLAAATRRGQREAEIHDLVSRAAAPEEIGKIPEAKVTDAAVADAERMRDQGQGQIYTRDAQGNVVSSSLDQPLAEADATAALAKEIRACAGPAAEAAE